MIKRKYRNQPVVVDGLKFDSKREANRWQVLRLQERAGDITQLKRQVPFVLAASVKIEGEKRARPALRTVIDFTYWRNCAFVVEDTKVRETQVSRIKRHLMKSVHGIDVRLS